MKFIFAEIIISAADKFLGSSLSSWTQTVMVDRFVEGRDNHESILDVDIKGKWGDI